MKKIILITSIVYLFLSCDTNSMSEQDRLIEESFNAENPFIGVWKPVDGSNHEIAFDPAFNLVANEIGIGAGYFNYSFNGEILTLFIYGSNTVAEEFPYDFSNKRTFVFFSKEIRKISTTLP